MKFKIHSTPLPREIEAENGDEVWTILGSWFEGVVVEQTELPKDFDLGCAVGEAMDFMSPDIQYEGLSGDGLAHRIKDHIEEQLEEDGLVVMNIPLRTIKKAIAEFDA